MDEKIPRSWGCKINYPLCEGSLLPQYNAGQTDCFSEVTILLILQGRRKKGQWPQDRFISSDMTKRFDPWIFILESYGCQKPILTSI